MIAIRTRQDQRVWDQAQDTNTPQDVLEELAKHEKWVVRAEVAHNPSTPVHVLEELARDEKWEVRWRAATGQVSFATLLLLVVDENEFVKKVAEKNLKERVQRGHN